MSISHSSDQDVTRMLAELRDGARDVEADLAALLYDELRAAAGSAMRGERANHTLQATALVNEAWLRLCGPDAPDTTYETRRHFLRVASRAMRNILVDHARGKRAHKRGGDACQVPLDEITAQIESTNVDLLALDEALTRLADHDARMAQVVELRYFGGLTLAQTAESLELTSDQVYYSWELARAWLHRELSRA